MTPARSVSHHGGVDLIRHALAISVIVMHMRSTSRYDPQTLDGLQALTQWLDGAVLGFFLISGLVVSDAGGWTLARGQQLLKRYMGPYLLFSVLYATVQVALGIGQWATWFWGVVWLHGAAMQLYFLPRLLVLHGVLLALRQTLQPDVARGWMLVCTTLLALVWPTKAVSGSDFRVWPLYGVAFAAGGLIRASTVWQLRWGRVLALAAAAGAVGLYDPRFQELAMLLPGLAAFVFLSRGLADHRFPGSGGVFLLHAPIINYAVSTWLHRWHVVQWANVWWSVAVTYTLTLLLTLWFIRRFPAWRWALLE